MAKRDWHKTANLLLWSTAVVLATLIALPAVAEAQVVNNCQPSQYLDRTAPGADRQLTWDFSISTDPERCLQVQAGQTVVWNGDLDVHPLAGNGGDNPNPISFHQNGAVTFKTAGTFGFQCLSHSPMNGAIKVVLAPIAAAPAPALPTWLGVGLVFLLLAMGWGLIRNQRRPATHS